MWFNKHNAAMGSTRKHLNQLKINIVDSYAGPLNNPPNGYSLGCYQLTGLRVIYGARVPKVAKTQWSCSGLLVFSVNIVGVGN